MRETTVSCAGKDEFRNSKLTYAAKPLELRSIKKRPCGLIAAGVRPLTGEDDEPMDGIADALLSGRFHRQNILGTLSKARLIDR